MNIGDSGVLRLVLMIALMAAVTYLIRMLPLLLFRRKLRNRFVRSLLYYIPYAVLAAMIVPDIFTSTASVFSAMIALIVAVVLSVYGRSLLTVALAACASVYVAELVMRLLG